MPQATRQSNTGLYWIIEIFLLLPPALLWLGIALHTFFQFSTLHVLLVGESSDDVIRTVLFLIICPLAAAGLNIDFLRYHKKKDVAHSLSTIVMIVAIVSVLTVSIYLFTGNGQCLISAMTSC